MCPDGDAGGSPALATSLERHRRELQVHCYRMLGSLEDAEDLVQETFLRAWRARSDFSFQGHAALRAWLYRIATNACLDFLAAHPRRAVADRAGPQFSEAEVPDLFPAFGLPVAL